MKEPEKPKPPAFTPPVFSGADAASSKPIRPGDICPQCGQGKMDYNGLLELECIKCGYVISGGGGCT